MASILTNTGAMVALQTLRGVNDNLATTQSQISTGKSVATAKDNAATWAISKVMESDVKGFRGIKESLSLGQSTISVARAASESITDLLTDIKGKIVAAQESNVDRAKIQTDIEQLRNQIGSVVNASQFNGVNLVRGSEDVNILSSLDRAEDGTVTARSITVARQDLAIDAAQFGDGDALTAPTVAGLDGTDVIGTRTTGAIDIGGTDITAAQAGTGTVTIDLGGGTAPINVEFALAEDDSAADVRASIAAAINALAETNADLQAAGFVATDEGGNLTFSVSGTFNDATVSFVALEAATDLTFGGDDVDTNVATIAATAATVTFDSGAPVNANDSYRVTVGEQEFVFVAREGDTFEDVANGLAGLINGSGSEALSAQVTEDAGVFTLAVANSGAAVAFAADGAEDGVAAGGLNGLMSIDVSTREGAVQALDDIEQMIQLAIDASAAFGSTQSRIDNQMNFVNSLTDSLRAGIGTLVDADMEEASARLQALQVQQQLAIQSLSIANQAPQNILSLFR